MVVEIEYRYLKESEPKTVKIPGALSASNIEAKIEALLGPVFTWRVTKSSEVKNLGELIHQAQQTKNPDALIDYVKDLALQIDEARNEVRELKETLEATGNTYGAGKCKKILTFLK